MAEDCDSDVFVDPDETINKPKQSQRSVKDMLQKIESTDMRPRQKRSGESQGSTSENVLLSKFDEVMSLIRKENAAHRESILGEIKKELSTAVKEIETKLEAVKARLEQKVADLEYHVSERDDLVEKLNDEVKAARNEVRKMKEEVELRDMQWRSS